MPLSPPCNAKGVECHKSPFDLSNQARSCCMQTFVIGSRGVWRWWWRGVSGLFCPSASLGCSWWSPPKDEGMEGRWEGRERTGWRRKKDTAIKRGADSETKEKMSGESPAPALFSILLSLPLFHPNYFIYSCTSGVRCWVKPTGGRTFRFSLINLDCASHCIYMCYR